MGAERTDSQGNSSVYLPTPSVVEVSRVSTAPSLSHSRIARRPAELCSRYIVFDGRGFPFFLLLGFLPSS